MYDPLTDRTVRLEHVGDRDVQGRNGYQFEGLLHAPLVNSTILTPMRTAIANMTTVGDGNTMPLLAVQAIAPRLPFWNTATRCRRYCRNCPTRSCCVRLAHHLYRRLDEQLSAPLFLAQDQTTLLAINTGYSTIPMLPLMRLSAQSTPGSVSEVVDTVSALGHRHNRSRCRPCRSGCPRCDSPRLRRARPAYSPSTPAQSSLIDSGNYAGRNDFVGASATKNQEVACQWFG